MYFLELALRVGHILGAVLLVGSIFMQKWVIVPVLSNLSEGPDQPVATAVRRRWARTVMVGSGLLLVTGLVNTARTSMAYRFPDGDYNLLLGIKLLLALVVMFIASVLSGRSAAAERWRQNLGMWLNVLVLASAIVLGLAGAMKMAKRELKSVAPSDTTTAERLSDPSSVH